MSKGRKRGRPAHDDVLTPAEWRVVEAVRHGLSNREIAVRRRISADAVKFHVANVLLKLGLPNRAALRRWTGISRASALHGRTKIMTQLTLGPLGVVRERRGLEEAREHLRRGRARTRG